MKNYFRAILFLLTVQAFAEIIHDPADPTIAMFDQAKASATSRISRIRSCSLRYVSNLEDERWILERQHELAQDVAWSRHYWYSDQNTVCNVTQFCRYADLQLFHPACERVAQTPREAEYFIIKASVNHFGVFEEARARRLALAILDANLNCQPSIPQCPQPCQHPQCCNNLDLDEENDI